MMGHFESDMSSDGLKVVALGLLTGLMEPMTVRRVQKAPMTLHKPYILNPTRKYITVRGLVTD